MSAIPYSFKGTTMPKLTLVLLVCVMALAESSLAQEDSDYATGLVGQYSDGATDASRLDRRIAFGWEGSPIRQIRAKAYKIRWTGFLMSQTPGKYRFYVHASGRFQLTIGGKQVIQGDSKNGAGWFKSAEIQLPFDFHPLQLSYQKAATGGRIALFWSGPKFQLEPISERHFFHSAKKRPGNTFESGDALVHGLRCAACHKIPAEPDAMAAPALDHFSAAVRTGWLVNRLTGTAGHTGQMPQFKLSRQQAESIAAYLADNSTKPKPLPVNRPKRSRKKKVTAAERITSANGRRLFVTIGCLACHQVGKLGTSGTFGGGDLSLIADKRPASFFEHWLAAPKSLNRSHRMPIFKLSLVERKQLARYLQTLGSKKQKKAAAIRVTAARVAQGKRLFQQHGCQNCHGSHERVPWLARTTINKKSNWSRSCLSNNAAKAKQPQFRLDKEQQRDVHAFVARLPEAGAVAHQPTRLLRQLNCKGCHARDHQPGIASILPELRKAEPGLASLLPALTPPALTGVGDKLQDQALSDAVRSKEARRPWLKIRMPKFSLSPQAEAAIVGHFIASDRIPPGQVKLAKEPRLRDLKLAGRRLVTTSGFGCTSCHQVGSVLPPKAPLNALGPNLSLMGKRIRRAWYERFVRNPARMVPRMEMPSLQLAVRGVLAQRLDHQISAVWHVLNEPGFEPPLPNPVRIVRHSGVKLKGRASVLTDVLFDRKKQRVKPVLIGLPNRHNVLLDFATARMVRWSIGDVANQRTRGKTWFWVAAGNDILRYRESVADLQLKIGDRWKSPRLRGQFPTEIDEVIHVPGGVRLVHRLQVGDRQLKIAQTFTTLRLKTASGFRRTVSILGAGSHALRVLALPADLAGELRTNVVRVAADRDTVIRANVVLSRDKTGIWAQRKERQSSKTAAAEMIQLDYVTRIPVDQFLAVSAAPKIPLQPLQLNVVPGFRATRLPIAASSLMPTGLSWRSDGTLFITSLKGRVWQANDTNKDGLEDRLRPFGDELAAPFGVAAYDRYVDVINKYALLRLYDEDQDGRCEKTVRLASGWGHTADYHDWAVGLPRDRDGNYFLAISCQQDNRSLAAAKLRGTVLRLSPQKGKSTYKLDYWTGGHRFPIGLALNRKGQLFVTDNQGHYNPFNELNHVRRGKHYGFINKSQRKPGFNPPLTPPAIDIPHPWTRSVNGICFLETPPQVMAKSGSRFGPFEGHLVGCEYDTRRLVRMSLQRVKGQFQGAAYPFSYDRPAKGQPLLGPLVSAISPAGDLYVGCIRDSGWGGANNIGTLVKLSKQPGDLPAGIAEVQAIKNGLLVRFTQPVDGSKGRLRSSYSLSTYRRIPTPSYGGPDHDRRVEKIQVVKLSRDRKQVTLHLSSLRKGFVHELRIKNLANRGEFFPSEAFYTMRNTP